MRDFFVAHPTKTFAYTDIFTDELMTDIITDKLRGDKKILDKAGKLTYFDKNWEIRLLSIPERPATINGLTYCAINGMRKGEKS